MSKKITLEKVSTIFWLTAKNISILNLLDKNHHSFFCVINHYKRAHCKKFSIRRLSVPHNFHRHGAKNANFFPAGIKLRVQVAASDAQGKVSKRCRFITKLVEHIAGKQVAKAKAKQQGHHNPRHEYGFGFTVITKSDRILRDLDLLQKINEKTKCVVQITLTTHDEELCKKLEPNVSTTRERFNVLLRLRDAGIPTVVWLCPILPFINDTKENIAGILEYCAEARVRGIINFGMNVANICLRSYIRTECRMPALRQAILNAF